MRARRHSSSSSSREGALSGRQSLGSHTPSMSVLRSTLWRRAADSSLLAYRLKPGGLEGRSVPRCGHRLARPLEQRGRLRLRSIGRLDARMGDVRARRGEALEERLSRSGPLPPAPRDRREVRRGGAGLIRLGADGLGRTGGGGGGRGVLAVVGGASGRMCGAGRRGGTLSSRAGNSPLLARSSAHLLGARV